MDHLYIRSDEQLSSFCQRIITAKIVGFDTEFVSEDTYRPDLCLIQVAADGDLAVIDPKAVRDVRPFWDAICSGDHITVVHAGREEFRFCLQAAGRRPSNLFDTQLASGLIGLDYPASYGKLLSRLLNRDLAKGETRTDWRRRPLSAKQIEYALQDVIYLEPLFNQIQASLDRLHRAEWLAEEMTRWQSGLEAAEQRENWRRVSGSTGLPEKAMVIVRELWRWRESEAEQQNRPPRRILRDDLLVELSRRGKSEVSQIQAIRGIERSGARRHFDQIARVIKYAQSLPKSEWPKRPPRNASSHSNLVGQFIATALTTICRSQQLAPGLVGTVQDVRDLVESRLRGVEQDPPPALSQGWRANVVGRTIDELLGGDLAIRIQDPRSDEPLALERIPSHHEPG